MRTNLRIPRAPRGATQALSCAIAEMGGLIPARDASLRERDTPLRRSPGIPVYAADAADLSLPYATLSEVAGLPVAWRFVLGVVDRLWLAELGVEEGRGTVLNQVLGAPSAARLMVAWRFAELVAQSGDVLRLLKLPSSGLEVLWLAGSDDRIVDLGFAREPELAGLDFIAKSMRRRP
jgi:hypothetical protein